MKKTMSLIFEFRQSQVLARLIPVLAAGIFAAAAPAHATLDPGAAASGYYFTNTPATGYVFGGYNRGSTINVGETSYSHQNAAQNLSANAFMGEIKIFNEVVRTNTGTSQGMAAGGFQDMITISDPARTGNQGVFNGSLRIDMDQVTTGSWYSNFFGVSVWDSMGAARVSLSDGYASYAQIAYNFFYTAPISIHTDLAFSVAFTFGTPFDIGVWMTSSAQVGGYGEPGTVRHDATHTLAWNGVTSIQDTTTGTTLAPGDYTATGAQGMNWAGPVPEPSTALLMFGSAAMLLLRRRRVSAP